MSSLQGKVAIVTGAAKGIGAAIAIRLAADGAAVAVNYANSASGAQATVDAITAAGGKAIAVKANVVKRDEVTALFEQTRNAFGPVDILVNNAGIYNFAPIEAIDEAHIDSQFDINVKGLLFAIQEAVKDFDNGRGGAIVNIGSIVSLTPPAYGSVYSATKGAVDVITKSLAQELGPKGIRVNAVAPGVTLTEGFHSMAGHENFIDVAKTRTPLGRPGAPDDIADAVAFLVSNDARWVTGSILPAGGGLTL
jgi:3-oxoacyl-[acyl-carrier protein] reductase